MNKQKEENLTGFTKSMDLNKFTKKQPNGKIGISQTTSFVSYINQIILKLINWPDIFSK